MTTKIADDPVFHKQWQSLMKANENLLSALHRETDHDVLDVHANEVRACLNRLMSLAPVRAFVTIHKKYRELFESIATDLKVNAELSGVIRDETWIPYTLAGTRDRILNLADQFKVSVKWDE